ncbi:MAG: hypothetical protein H7Z41_09560 [Cytophagales bacterium]|nr:hypothetical protein [Armatimonadota bacterium]
MSTIVVTYLVYLVISVSLTVWVARTLFKNGRVFLVDVFHGNETLADSVNQLLVVGFYLINLGYVSLMLKINDPVIGTQASIEALAGKVGLVLLVLGGMHFFNLFVFNKVRTTKTEEWRLAAALEEQRNYSRGVVPGAPTAQMPYDMR